MLIKGKELREKELLQYYIIELGNKIEREKINRKKCYKV